MKVEPVAYTHESYLHPATLHFEAMKKPHPSFPVPLYAIPTGYALVPVEQVKDAERYRYLRDNVKADVKLYGNYGEWDEYSHEALDEKIDEAILTAAGWGWSDGINA